MSTTSSLLLPGRGSVHLFYKYTSRNPFPTPSITSPHCLIPACTPHLVTIFVRQFVFDSALHSKFAFLSAVTPPIQSSNPLRIHFRLECWYSFFCCGVISFKISRPLHPCKRICQPLWACVTIDLPPWSTLIAYHVWSRGRFLDLVFRKNCFKSPVCHKKLPFDDLNVSQNLPFKQNKEHVKIYY